MRVAGLLFLALTLVLASDLVCDGSLASAAPALTCCGARCPAPAAGSDCCKVSNHSPRPTPSVLSSAKPNIGPLAIVEGIPRRVRTPAVIHRVGGLKFISQAPTREILCSLQI